MILAATDVELRYPGASVPALTGVHFHVGGGELVAVAGPNGSGKSSLMRVLMGLAPGAGGQVTLDGRPLAAWSRRATAEAIGALPQREETAFPMRVHDAVLLGRWARLGPLAATRAADRAAVEAAMARCHVTALASRWTDTLSGGEWQRVRLARALAGAPRLLLLDEPNAALDIAHEMSLFELLRHLVADGLGVMVITHHLNLAARNADRIVLLDRGRVAADGAPRDVLRQETLDRVFEWPVAVTTWCDGAPQVVPLTRAEAVDANRPVPPPFEGSS